MSDIVAQTFTLLRERPKQTLLPMLVVQGPLSVIIAGATLALYLTAFRDQPVDEVGRLLTEQPRGQQFMSLAIGAVQALFSLVAFGATSVSVAALLRGRVLTLPEALDPAFTRMGALLGVAVITLAGTAAIIIPVAGIFLAIYVFLRLALMLPVVMIEDVGPARAMRRSWTLMRRNRMTLLGLALVAAGLIAIPWLGMTYGALLAGEGRTAAIVANVLLNLANGVVLAPMLSFAMAAVTVFYLEVSAREEIAHA